MPWNKVIGQENIKQELQRMILSNRIPNALCFWGNIGVGKFATAIEFVKTNSCLRPRKENDFIESCGECSHCLRINAGTFPNLDFLFSLPPGKASDIETGTIATLSDEQIGKIIEALNGKISNPYRRFQIEGANQIRVNQVRELRQKLALSNSLSGRKFVLIIEANEMRTEAQNAFLKTLEEPRPNITFILICSNKNALLPTILSRCQSIYFPPLPEELISKEIQIRLNLSNSASQLIAKFSDGSFTQALEFAGEEIQAIRNKMVDLLRQSLRKEIPSELLSKEISKFTEKMDKKQAILSMDLLLQWFRDCFILDKRKDSSVIRNYDDLQSIERFVRRFGTDFMNKIFDIITQCGKFVHSNVQISYVFFVLFLSIRNIVLSGENVSS